MPTPKLTIEKTLATLKALHKAGWPRKSITAIAGELKMPRQTIAEHVYMAKYQFGFDPRDKATWPKVKAQKLAAQTEYQGFARERQRFRDENQRLANQIRAMQRNENKADDLRSAVFKLAEMKLAPPKWVVKPAKAKGGPGIPMLFFSDAQWGEVIKASDMDGINEFNRDVASQRYKSMITKAIELCTEHMVNPVYQGFIYARGGDMISGEIHDELAKTNDLMAIPACKDLVEHEIWGIEKLLEHFPEVWVVSIPGNHGRTTHKPEAKGYAENNYDTLSAYVIETYFKGRSRDNPKYARVKFYTPASGDALFTVAGHTILLTHGDRMGSSGGQGFIGPVATIARGMKKLHEYYASIGTTIDYIFIGHYHTCLQLEFGFANGSLPGMSEYAKRFRMKPGIPQQWLVWIHPNHGVAYRVPILLEKKLRLGKIPYRELQFAEIT